MKEKKSKSKKKTTRKRRKKVDAKKEVAVIKVATEPTPVSSRPEVPSKKIHVSPKSALRPHEILLKIEELESRIRQLELDKK